MSTDRAKRVLFGAGVVAALFAMASQGCEASFDGGALADGRGAIPATPPAVGSSSPSPPADAGVHLPPEGASLPVPELAGVAPAAALVGGIAPTIAVTGTNFVPRSLVELDGKSIATSFVSDRELRATLPGGVMGGTGPHAVTVLTGAPGGGRSAASTFTVANPVATVTDLAPSSALANGADTSVIVTGTGFVTGSVASLAGTALTTTVVSASEVHAFVPASKLVVAGGAPVVVTNPAPGGGPSKALSFTIANPTVTVTTIAPSSAIVGSGAVTIDATGTGFVTASVASLNGAPLVTRVQSATSLTADVPAAALANVGNFPVIVTNPAPGGGVSVPVMLTVGNPSPAIATMAPSRATAGDPPTTVTIGGSGFVPTSQVAFDGAPSATTYGSATSLTATIPAVQLGTGGTIAVTVTNPAPGGGASGAVAFTVNNPTPVVTSVAPASIPAGSGDTTITAFGTNLVSGAVVTADGVALATIYVTATVLRALVPAAKLAISGSIAIRAANPDPGGSTSGAVTLTVTRATGGDAGATCDGTGVDVALDAPGVTRTIALAYANGPALRFAYDPDEPTFFTCPVAQLSIHSSSYAALVVQNTSGAPAYLEANAVCSAGDDAFLAVYDGLSAAPASDDGRRACTGFVANGSGGGQALASNQSNDSSYCPGLTAANGGAITLQPCERAVLIVQPYDVTQFTAPAQLAVSLLP